MILVLENLAFSGHSFSKFSHFKGVPSLTYLAGMVHGFNRHLNQYYAPSVELKKWTVKFKGAEDSIRRRVAAAPSKNSRESFFPLGSSMIKLALAIEVDGELTQEEVDDAVTTYNFRMGSVKSFETEGVFHPKAYLYDEKNTIDALSRMEGVGLKPVGLIGSMSDGVEIITHLAKVQQLRYLPSSTREKVVSCKEKSQGFIDLVQPSINFLHHFSYGELPLIEFKVETLLEQIRELNNFYRKICITQSGWSPISGVSLNVDTSSDDEPNFVEAEFTMFLMTSFITDFEFLSQVESEFDLSFIQKELTLEEI